MSREEESQQDDVWKPKVHRDDNGKTFYKEAEILALSDEQFDKFAWSKNPVTVDYIFPKRESALNDGYRRMLPIGLWVPTAFCLIYAAMRLETDSVIRDKLLPAMAGFMLWFPFEYTYHVLVHTSATNKLLKFVTDGKAKEFVFGKHVGHHLAPREIDRIMTPPKTVVQFAIGLYCLFSMMRMPNPMMVIAVMLLRFVFYDQLHCATHLDRPSTLKQVPLIGSWLVERYKQHQGHHANPNEKFAVSFSDPVHALAKTNAAATM